MKKLWPVVPLSKYQLLDIREEDILNDGDFRKCETYRGGGGYDQFPAICEKRLGVRRHKQFVVQLYGCNLDCPYCYVTRSGVWGGFKRYTTEDLVRAFEDSKQEVFHLMGGAPAIHINDWCDILDKMSPDDTFHSDLLLTEKLYSLTVLEELGGYGNALFAVNIKGCSAQDYKNNTRKDFNEQLFWENFRAIRDAGINFYVTFTNPNLEELESFKQQIVDRLGESVLDDHFVIPLIQYKALPFVDIKA